MRNPSLGEMEQLLKRRLPSLEDFLVRQRIRTQALLEVLPEITSARNQAAHEAHPALREEAAQIRRRWMGKTKDFPSIFALLMPASEGKAGTRP